MVLPLCKQVAILVLKQNQIIGWNEQFLLHNIWFAVSLARNSMQIFSFFPLSKLQVTPWCLLSGLRYLLSCLQVLTSVHRLLSALYPDAVSSAAAAAACQQVPLCSAGQTHSLQRDNPRSVNLCSIKLLWTHQLRSWGGVELCQTSRSCVSPWRFCPPPTKW